MTPRAGISAALRFFVEGALPDGFRERFKFFKLVNDQKYLTL